MMVNDDVMMVGEWSTGPRTKQDHAGTLWDTMIRASMNWPSMVVGAHPCSPSLIDDPLSYIDIKSSNAGCTKAMMDINCYHVLQS